MHKIGSHHIARMNVVGTGVAPRHAVHTPRLTMAKAPRPVSQQVSYPLGPTNPPVAPMPGGPLKAAD